MHGALFVLYAYDCVIDRAEGCEQRILSPSMYIALYYNCTERVSRNYVLRLTIVYFPFSASEACSIALNLRRIYLSFNNCLWKGSLISPFQERRQKNVILWKGWHCQICRNPNGWSVIMNSRFELLFQFRNVFTYVVYNFIPGTLGLQCIPTYNLFLAAEV